MLIQCVYKSFFQVNQSGALQLSNGLLSAKFNHVQEQLRARDQTIALLENENLNLKKKVCDFLFYLIVYEM